MVFVEEDDVGDETVLIHIDAQLDRYITEALSDAAFVIHSDAHRYT